MTDKIMEWKFCHEKKRYNAYKFECSLKLKEKGTFFHKLSYIHSNIHIIGLTDDTGVYVIYVLT